MNESETPGSALQSVLGRLAREEPRALERLFGLLAIPSVSTDPAYHQACVDAAECCAGLLREAGFDARVVPTSGKPMVVGHSRARPSAKPRRHALFYGHYDVQPPEPFEAWTVPPFQPHLADDPHHGKVIVARGASDVTEDRTTGPSPDLTLFYSGQQRVADLVSELRASNPEFVDPRFLLDNAYQAPTQARFGVKFIF